MMDAVSLASQFVEQLRQIVEATPFPHIRRVEMTLGALYGIAAKDLEMCFDDVFDSEPADSRLAGAVIEITVVQAGQTFAAPLLDDATQTANGWELLITNIEGG